MFAKFLSPALAVLLTSTIGSAPAVAQSQTTNPQHVDKVREQVMRLRARGQTTVEIKLTDGSKRKGYIGEIAEDRFTIIEPRNSTVTTILYEQVEKIGNTRSRSWYAPILLAAGTIVGVWLLVILSLRGS